MRKHRRLFYLLFLILILVLGFYTVFIEPGSLILREERFVLKGLKSSVRLALVSDLHTGSFRNSFDHLRRVVEKTNEQHPDLILLPGDFVISGVLGGTFVEPEAIAAILKNLKAPLGIYATLGNHDWWYDGDRVRRALESVGIEFLENKSLRLETKGNAFWLMGIGDVTEKKEDLKKAFETRTDPSLPTLAMTHSPDLFPQIPSEIPLVLAGHTHGGQVRLPLIGRPIVPSKYKDRYSQGFIFENNHSIYVTAGVGTSILPVRFRIPPEIVLMTLTPSP